MTNEDALRTAKCSRSRPAPRIKSGGDRLMRTLILVILVLLLIGALPTWPYSAQWGYYPSGGLGTVLVIVLILWLLGVVLFGSDAVGLCVHRIRHPAGLWAVLRASGETWH